MSEAELIADAGDEEIARWLHGHLSIALAAAEGQVAICIPGGTTPFPILDRLAAMKLDWPRLTIWPGDDRVVREKSSGKQHRAHPRPA